MAGVPISDESDGSDKSDRSDAAIVHPKDAIQLAVSLQVARASLSSPPKSNKKS